jgi:hypothetical protein
MRLAYRLKTGACIEPHGWSVAARDSQFKKMGMFAYRPSRDRFQ